MDLTHHTHLQTSLDILLVASGAITKTKTYCAAKSMRTPDHHIHMQVFLKLLPQS